MATRSKFDAHGPRRDNICRVGYALNQKKLRAASVSAFDFEVQEEVKEEAHMPEQGGPWCGGGLATIVGASLKSSVVVDGVVFVPINDEKEPPEEVDIILHKLTGDIVKSTGGQESPRLQMINKIIEKNPNVEIVDPIESVGRVVSRLKTNERIADLMRKGLGKDMTPGMGALFDQPKFALVDDEGADFAEVMKTNSLTFPVICKPERACGVAESHHMNIVLDVEGFKEIPRPFIMQQYHNHNAVFSKVYVIGDNVMMFRRQSLPNFSLEEKKDSGKESAHVIPFDSRKPYPTLENYHGSGITVGDDFSSVEESDACSQGQLEEVARNLSNSFGLSLFGFDIIVPTTGEGRKEDAPLLIVDVNFFPSYKEVPDFPRLLRGHLRKRAGFA